MTKIAFVTPWYGRDIPGGAEEAARSTAEHMQRAGMDVEVLTTCIKDFYADWGRNYHQPGQERVNDVMVRRFPVQKRNRQAFDQVNWRLANGLEISAEEEQVFLSEMIQAPTLLEYIRQHSQEYLFFFIPYMFATTYYGCQIAPERSIVIPCLHDEAYARLDGYRKVLPVVKGLVLLTEAESALVSQLYGAGGDQVRQVIGAGIDATQTAKGDRFRQKYGLDRPFVLYAGRREAGKNTPLLLDFWQRYVQSETRDVKLVLIGPGEVPLSPALESSVVDLGFVPEQDKLDAYAAADVFCQPSVHESFSIVLMESWLAGRPVLVHNGCAVNVEHCKKANGGLFFANFDEFRATLDYLLDHPDIATKLGQQGRRYVLQNYSWKKIIAKYQRLIDEVLGT